MTRKAVRPAARLASIFAASTTDEEFARFLREQGQLDDADLSEVIERDGRYRIMRDQPISLERYLNAVPDLLDRQDPLDAAIDVTLRWMSGNPRADEHAVAILVRKFPKLEAIIRDCASLNNALWSTNAVQEKARGVRQRQLPQDFGPLMEDGGARYELIELVGAGAFGQVFKAVDRQLSEPDHPALVAVKIFNDRIDDDADEHRLLGRARLVEEATKARRVDHPNVVRVLDRGITDEQETYIVYELIDGGDLQRWMREQSGHILVRDAVALVAKIARGVQAAHSAGLVHCDLKPNNIILTANGEPKIADFGIAIRFGDSGSGTFDGSGGQDASKHPIGNFAFISPEQFRMDEGALTAPADVYALGGILFTLLVKELPNGSTKEEIARTHDPEHGRTAPPRLRPLRRDIDEDLEAICRRALAVEPKDRYSSAGLFASDLEAWLRHEPLYWTKPGALRVLNLWRKRKPAVAAISLLLSISVIGGGMTALHFAQRAAVARLQAATAKLEVATAEAEATQALAEKEIAELREARLARQSRSHLDRLSAQVDNLSANIQDSRTTTQVLPMIWSLEYLVAPSVTGSRAPIMKSHQVRFEAIQNLVNQAVAEGRDNHLDTLLWKTNLAFWLVGEGKVDQARPLLDEVKTRWQSLLSPDDRWLKYIAAIEHCAVIKSIAAVATEVGIDSRQAQTLEQLEPLIIAHEQNVREDDPKSPIHFLLVETLVQLYQPEMLDRPERLTWASEHREVYGGRRAAQ